MGKAFLGPLSQLQVTDFEELRSYRAPPESVVQVTDVLCDLFHRERGWASAKQLLCTEDFYQVGMWGTMDEDSRGIKGRLGIARLLGQGSEQLCLPSPLLTHSPRS